MTGPGTGVGDELPEPGLAALTRSSAGAGSGIGETVMQLQIVGRRARFPRAQLVDPPSY